MGYNESVSESESVQVIMVKRFHRALAGVLAVAALSLQSCGIIIISNPTAEESSPTETTHSADTSAPQENDSAFLRADKSAEYQAWADAYLAQTAAAAPDYDGRTFFIAAPRADLIDADTEADSYSAAIHRRNKAVSDALNADIAVSLTDGTAFLDLLSQSITVGEYFSDLLMIPEEDIGTFSAGGVLINLRSVPMLDLSRPFFFDDSVSAASAGSGIWAVAGPASLEISTLSAVFFNRDLLEKNSIALPYADVYAGRWTWDRFTAITAAASGINGVSSWAAQYSAELLPAMIYVSGDMAMVRSSVGEAPRVALSAEDYPVFDVITRLYNDENRFTSADGAVSAFHTGGALTLIDRLYLMSWMPNSTQNWGIVPLPKMSEEQTAYVTLTDPSALMFAIPKHTTDAENGAILLTALNAASYGVLSEAYVDYAMNHLLRDNDSANMLAIISASCRFDFASAFSSAVPSLADATVKGLADLAAGLSTAQLVSRSAAANEELSSRFAP